MTNKNIITDIERMTEMRKALEQFAAGRVGVEPATGNPFDNPRFETLCREHGILGTAQAALCAVFWRAASTPPAQTAEPAPVAKPSAQKADATIVKQTPIEVPEDAFGLLVTLSRNPWYPGLAPLIPILTQPLYTSPQPALTDNNANMFWNEDGAAKCYKSISEILEDVRYYDSLEVGEDIAVLRARELPKVLVRVTAIYDGKVEYEIIDAAMAAKDAS